MAQRRTTVVDRPRVRLEKTCIMFSFPYSEAAVSMVKALPREYRTWNAQERYWRLSPRKECFQVVVDVSTKVFGTTPDMSIADGVDTSAYFAKAIDTTSYYAILEVDPSATPDVIKKAYRKKIVHAHPDRGGSEADFIAIQRAYECLSDPKKRKRYDIARKVVAGELTMGNKVTDSARGMTSAQVAQMFNRPPAAVRQAHNAQSQAHNVTLTVVNMPGQGARPQAQRNPAIVLAGSVYDAQQWICYNTAKSLPFVAYDNWRRIQGARDTELYILPSAILDPFEERALRDFCFANNITIIDQR